MLAGIHLLTGNALAVTSTHHPLASFLVGILSHHILDMLPHLDTNIFGEKGKSIRKWPLQAWILVISELLVMMIIAIVFLYNKRSLWPLAFWGGVGGILPDILTILFSDVAPLRNKITRSYIYFQSELCQFRKPWRKFLKMSLLIYLLVFIFDLSLLSGL